MEMIGMCWTSGHDKERMECASALRVAAEKAEAFGLWIDGREAKPLLTHIANRVSAECEQPTPSVYDYFCRTFGVTPDDETLNELKVTDPCGVDCVKAIDAGKALLDAADPYVLVDLLKVVNTTIEVFWRG